MSTGLRERKKTATRAAIHEAAVRLAAEHGVEHLTVEAIADAATVSRRTFSNYFASKEQALLYGDRTRLERLLDLVRARPAAEPPWTAMTRAAEVFTDEHPARDPSWLAELRVVRRHPTLLAEQIATYAATERELAAEITRRLPAEADTPLRARLLAAAFLTTLRVATQSWIELDQPASQLGDLVRQALKLTRERFR
jgi:AcrR family transcriptional regulator